MLSRFVAIITCAELLVLAVTALPNAGTWSSSQEATHDQTPVATLHLLVLDRARRPVTDLNKNELKLYEGKEEQSIESLTLSPAAPANIGLLVDISRSNAASLRAMKLPKRTEFAGGLLRTGDLAFVATFAKSHSLVSPLTSDLGRIEEAFESSFNPQPGTGTTSMLDAMFWACSEEFPARAGHKALIIFSDMLDNTSDHTLEEVLARAQRSGIVIYPILLRETSPWAEPVVRSFADETGGLSFLVYKLEALEQTLRAIRNDLDDTYVIAYRPKSHGPASVKVRCTRKGVKIIAPDRRY